MKILTKLFDEMQREHSINKAAADGAGRSQCCRRGVQLARANPFDFGCYALPRDLKPIGERKTQFTQWMAR